MKLPILRRTSETGQTPHDHIDRMSNEMLLKISYKGLVGGFDSLSLQYIYYHIYKNAWHILISL